MRNKHTYVATIETKNQLSFLKKLMKNDTLDSTETKMIYYVSRNNGFKLNENVVVVPLKKVVKGYIIYISTYVYGIGKFIYVTDKEYKTLNTFNFKYKKNVNIFQWRYLYYFESVLNEFVNPLTKIKSEEIENEMVLKYTKFSGEVIAKEKKKLLARF